VEGKLYKNPSGQIIELTSRERVSETEWSKTGIFRQVLKDMEGVWRFELDDKRTHWLYTGITRRNNLLEVNSEIVVGKPSSVVVSVRTLRGGILVSDMPEMDSKVNGFLIMTTEERRKGSPKRRSTIY